MKKKTSILLVVLAIVMLILPIFSYAQEIQKRTEDETVINSEENQEDNQEDNQVDNNVVYSDLYILEDNNYEMNKNVDGNVFIIASGDVKISGLVKGSVYVLSSGDVSIDIDAGIGNSLYVVTAKNISISGAVYDVYTVSEKFETTDEAIIYRDINSIAGNAKLRGYINRNINISAVNIDVKDESSSLEIGGNFNYKSEKEIENLSDIVTSGKINYSKQVDSKQTKTNLNSQIGHYIVNAITSIIYTLIIYFILSLIAPKFVERIGKDLKQKGIVAFAIGLLSIIIGIIGIVLSIFLLLTTITMPIAAVYWFIIFIVIYMSNAVFSISVLGIFKEKMKDNKALQIVALIGINLAIWLLQQIPYYIGSIVSTITVITGIGLIIRNVIERKVVENSTIEEKA